jgi:hypothetical protein
MHSFVSMTLFQLLTLFGAEQKQEVAKKERISVQDIYSDLHMK